MTTERIEIQRTIPPTPATIFAVLSDPQGHVTIDSSGMLQSATGEPVTAVGDTFVVHMDREALNDYPMGQYDVTVTITAYEQDREIAWTILGRSSRRSATSTATGSSRPRTARSSPPTTTGPTSTRRGGRPGIFPVISARRPAGDARHPRPHRQSGRGLTDPAAPPPAPAPAWIVAGPPGAGKSTVATLLLGSLTPVPALLDKDTMYGSFVAATLAAAAVPGEREGDWYDEHVKAHEYAGMTATAREIRAYGCPVLLSGPFTGPIHDACGWQSWIAESRRRACLAGLGAIGRADAARPAGARRGSPRDAAKLAAFGEFAARIRLEHEPAAPHAAVDNRLGAPVPLPDQIAALAARWAGERT